MRRAALMAILLFLAACSDGSPPPSPVEPATSATTAPSSTTTSTTSTTTTTIGTLQPTATSAPPTLPPPVPVTAPGDYGAERLQVGLRFISEVPEIATSDLAAIAIEILNDGRAWPAAGFTFVLDEASELTVILAEGERVDELCLPLETFGTVNCQNGPIVALNADRWRQAFDEWDSTVADYRRYVVNHEVGHLIGMRHPSERCPTEAGISALMEPQTRNLQGCGGNSLPFDWEVDWAKMRPAVVGPDPDWDGPRAEWPPDG